jgi:GGDEF domain-containing protein
VDLAERAEDLAKGWLLALVEQEPLARAPSIAAAELASAGPAICTALVRALGSDTELQRIAAGGDLEPLVSRIGELAGAQSPEEASRAAEALRAVLWSAALGALGDPDSSLVAELAERLAAVCELARGAALRRLTGLERPGIADVLAAAISRARRDGTALSLLLVELEDAARMLAVEPAPEAGAVFDRLAAAVRGAARAGDPVIAEDRGRVWVIAPGVEREGSGRIGKALAEAVREGGSWRGAPLRASIGVATLDRDAVDAPGLIEAAEEASFTAAAGGIEVARAGAPEEPA